MPTRWTAAALTARLRLLRVLAAQPNSSTVAASKLRLIEIARAVDCGTLPPEMAERFLVTLAERLERQESDA